MKKYLFTILLIPLLCTAIFADNIKTKEPNAALNIPRPEGWSIDVGGAYTWMSLSTPPSYSGSTGGILGKVTYQQSNFFFGQARTVYNLGPLSSSTNDANFYEWYMEFVCGYCACAISNWTITPYVGVGFDFLSSHQTAYDGYSAIQLNYALDYAIIGLETHYSWQDWMLGLQIDCLPTFKQYLEIKNLPESAWTLKNRVGADVRLPISYRYVKNFWIEFSPYYRFLSPSATQIT